MHMSQPQKRLGAPFNPYRAVCRKLPRQGKQSRSFTRLYCWLLSGDRSLCILHIYIYLYMQSLASALSSPHSSLRAPQQAAARRLPHAALNTSRSCRRPCGKMRDLATLAAPSRTQNKTKQASGWAACHFNCVERQKYWRSTWTKKKELWK